MVMNSIQHWQANNRAALDRRLSWLREQPSKTLFFEPSGVHFISVKKIENVVQLGLLEQTSLSTQLLQSQLDLTDPLNLLSPYTQAMMLSLLWHPTPQRIYLAGFGGGRIPLVLHHFFPTARVECSEIDPTLVEVAKNFFGVELDDRLQVRIQDGRSDLAAQETTYDIIAIDVVLGTGYMPYSLATREFYQLCKRRLSASGVVTVNLLQPDPFYADRVKTLQGVFDWVGLVPLAGGNAVAIATDGEGFSPEEIRDRAQSLQADLGFSFPLSERSGDFIAPPQLQEHLPELSSAQLLCDDSIPGGYFQSLPAFNTVFSLVDPKLPCPCGSGRLFERCHGGG